MNELPVISTRRERREEEEIANRFLKRGRERGWSRGLERPISHVHSRPFPPSLLMGLGWDRFRLIDTASVMREVGRREEGRGTTWEKKMRIKRRGEKFRNEREERKGTWEPSAAGVLTMVNGSPILEKWSVAYTDPTENANYSRKVERGAKEGNSKMYTIPFISELPLKLDRVQWRRHQLLSLRIPQTNRYLSNNELNRRRYVRGVDFGQRRALIEVNQFINGTFWGKEFFFRKLRMSTGNRDVDWRW